MDPANRMLGYASGDALMVIAAVVELRIGIAAECRPLAELAPPLSCDDAVPQRQASTLPTR